MMRRDTRKVLAFRWVLAETEFSNPIKLARAFRDLRGDVPDFDRAVAGIHFIVADGERALVLAKPARVQISGSLTAQVLTLIGAKYRCAVRLARPGEAPTFPAVRLPTASDLEHVEIWPAPRERPESVVAESLAAPGWYATDETDFRYQGVALAQHANGALVFDNASDAEEWLETAAPHQPFILRFAAAARAESDLREAAIFEDGV